MICLSRTSGREALRHVLDSTWVAMGQMDKMVEGRFMPDASWRAFADTITPYDKLDSAQQAAIVAMRGFLLYDAGKVVPSRWKFWTLKSKTCPEWVVVYCFFFTNRKEVSAESFKMRMGI